MLDKRVEDALNEQIKNELYSGYMYLAMAAYCESASLPGFGSWMQKQAAEEYGHAMKLYEYVYDGGGRVVLEAIDKPPTEYDSPLDVFLKTLEHEQKVTAMISKLNELAGEAQDHATQSMLKWFIDEQVEEEKTASGIVDQLKMAGSAGHALLMLDRVLGQR